MSDWIATVNQPSLYVNMRRAKIVKKVVEMVCKRTHNVVLDMPYDRDKNERQCWTCAEDIKKYHGLVTIVAVHFGPFSVKHL